GASKGPPKPPALRAPAKPGRFAIVRWTAETLGPQAGAHAGAISTDVLLNAAAAAGEARSPVKTLAQPCVSWPCASGVNQAPSLMETQPGAMRSVTRAGSTVAPRSLNTRTFWPSTMPRAAASAVFIQTSSRSARDRIGWLSWIECVRARDFGVTSLSGCRPSSGSGIQVGMGEIAPSPYGSGLAAMAIE